MLKRFRSFRVKLIVYFTAVFGMIQIMLSLTGLALRERQLRDVYDHQVMERISTIQDQLQATPAGITGELLTAIADRLPRGPHIRDYYVQVRDLNGVTLAKTSNLGDRELPYTPRMRDAVIGGDIDARVVASSEVRSGPNNENYRLITRRGPAGRNRSVVYQIATSFDHVDRSIASLRWFFYLGLPLGLAAAATTSWLVTSKLSYRINRVANLARELSPSDLSRRIGEPLADDEFADLVRNLNTMLDRLEAGFRAQERFIHDASHELKTPIAAILTEAQVLKMTGADPDECRKFVDSTIHELMHMSRLIESLLLLTRANKEQERDHFESCDVNDLVVEAVRRCRPLSEEYGVEVRITALDAEDTCATQALHCERELIVIMVSNLVRNAVRFTRRGGTVRVQTQGDADHVVITVADEGPGIDPDDLPHIFDRFYQGRHKAARRGTGLGLAIAQTVVELHDGRIEASNGPERGAVFTVHMPLRGRSAPPPSAQS
jgi:two-component system OmpR family sensor kinase